MDNPIFKIHNIIKMDKEYAEEMKKYIFYLDINKLRNLDEKEVENYNKAIDSINELGFKFKIAI